MGDDTLDLVLDNPCLVIPPEVCYHSTIYQTIVNLPFVQGGYQLVYQRCCRNQSIVNIQLPLETGATFYNFITEEALSSCNSSAVFNDWPPFYICKDLPFVFDHFATDLDGDSIVYSMCAPFDGASFDDPRPQPPFNPPYDSVVWVNPPYNTNDMLGGIPLSIDENGLLTAVPNTLGQFVVGICAQEYRNGQLISTSRRDFQFNVGICDLQIVSAFFAPEVQCEDDLTIFFNNQSNGSNNFLWDFGDGTTSTSESVTHTFPDSGLYEITLIAGVGNACADTSIQMVNVQFESIFTEFDVTFDTCEDSVIVNLIDLSVDTLSEIIAWNWDFGNGETSNEQFPSIEYTSPGVYTITLEVEAANGCTAQHTEQININIPFADFQTAQTICPGDGPVELNPGGDPALDYLWSPSDGLNDPTSPNPLASPSITTTYSVSTFIPNLQDTCFIDREVTVFVSPDVTLDVPNDTAGCDVGFPL
ncbi:MAG: PKD domain-containing protein, partial [Bacteroidota bacterium]